MSAVAPSCPSWCEESSRGDHWTRINSTMPWEAGHVRSFGPLVSVSVGHEVHDNGTARCWPAEVIVQPHRVETDDGTSLYRVPQAMNLAARIAEASAFALTLEGSHALA